MTIRRDVANLTWEFVIDLDGVVFEFIEDFESRFGDAHREYVSLYARYPERKEEIIDYVQNPKTYQRLFVRPLGLKIAKYLWDRADTAIHIVSSRPLKALEITKKRLSEIELHYDTISFRKDKVPFIKAIEPDMVIDDIISVLQGVQPIPGILAATAYNETPFFRRISTVEQFIFLWERFVDENIPNSARRARLAQGVSSKRPPV